MNSSVWAVWAAQDSKGKLALNEAAAANALKQPPPMGIFDRCVNPILIFWGERQFMLKFKVHVF